MPTPAEPAHEHLQFDAMCAEVDEFDNLPSLSVSPSQSGRDEDDEELLDDQILGGLVSPY
jgi:hypothetical protein